MRGEPRPGAGLERLPGPQPAAAGDEAASRICWLEGKALRGCNVFHERTVVSATIELGAPPTGIGGPSAGFGAGPGFAAAFAARFWDAAQVPPTAPPTAPFAAALRRARGVALERVLLEAVLALERRLAYVRRDHVPIEFMLAQRLGSHERQPQRVRLVWSSAIPALSLAAGRLACAGLNELLGAAAAPAAATFDTAWRALQRRAARRLVSPSMAVLLHAAHRRGIPWVGRGGSHMQLGQGAAQRITFASVPQEVSHAAAQLSRNKQRAGRQLARLDLPVPRQVKVLDVPQALAAAQSLGYPVVVKPLKGRQGQGVTVGVSDPDTLHRAFAHAWRPGKSVLIEEFVAGRTYRLLVIGGELHAALQIVPPSVTGDGRRRIDELVEELNRDPRRDNVRLYRVQVDTDVQACLARGGRTLSDVPGPGVVVTLRNTANTATGATDVDVTDAVHPSQRLLAERAAQVIGLSVAGVDIVAADIADSGVKAGSRIVEVNARPALDLHVYPTLGQPRDVGAAVLARMFAPPATGRVPTALIVGRRAGRDTARALASMLRAQGVVPGVALREAAAGADAPAAGRTALTGMLQRIWRDERVQAIVVAMSPKRALDRGLVVDRADVIALLPPEGAADEARSDELAALVVRAARGVQGVQGAQGASGKFGVIVVDAADTATLGRLRQALAAAPGGGTRLVLVGTRGRDTAIEAHRRDGGVAMLFDADARRGKVEVEVVHGKEVVTVHRTEGAGAAAPLGWRFGFALQWALRSVAGAGASPG